MSQNRGGGPQRPDDSAYRAKLSELKVKKGELLDQIKALQSSVKKDDAKAQLIEEKQAIQKNMDAINTLKFEKIELRTAKNEEKVNLQKRKREALDKQRTLQNRLSGFTSPAEIDAAIEYIRKQMESGGKPGLDRKKSKQISQLEDAKGIFVQLQSLRDTITALSKEETALQQQYVELQEAIGELNKQYYEERALLRAKDAEIKQGSEKVRGVYSECDALRVTLNETIGEMSKLKEEQDREYATYKEKQQQYWDRIQQERAEREQRLAESANTARREEKIARARARLNPREQEIAACTALIQFLSDKKHMVLREAEKRKMGQAAAHFDPVAAAPEGFVVVNEGEWKKGKKPAKEKKKKASSNHPPPPPSAGAPGSGVLNEEETQTKPPVYRFSEIKMRQFEIAQVEPPLFNTPEELDEKIAELKERRNHFEAQRGDGELVLSSDNDETEVQDDEMCAPHNDDNSETASAHESPESGNGNADNKRNDSQQAEQGEL